jgi:hypothetical protein
MLKNIGKMLIIFLLLTGCESNKTIAEYEGMVDVEVVNYDEDSNTVVLSYKLGDIEIVDDLSYISDSFFWVLAKRKTLELGIKITSSTGSV